MSRRSLAVARIVAGLIIAFLYLPLITVAVFSFNAGGGLALPLQGVSLRWYQALILDETFGAAFWASVRVAMITAILAAVVGSLAAYAFVRRRGRFLGLVELTSRLPVMIPPLLLGVMLLATIDLFDVVPSLVTVTAGHLIYVIPFAVVIMVARLRSVDPDLELAARDLGAGPWEAVRRITLPVLWPSVAATAAISFAFSFDEVLITTFTSGLDPTLPLFVVSRLRRTIDPSVNAVATIMIIVPWIALGVAAAFYRISARRSGRSIAAEVSAEVSS